MKSLSILRHAKSSWDQPELNDFDRPLNRRGQKNATLMGHWLKHCRYIPELILTSPAVRACTTAQLVASVLYDDPSERIGKDSRIYEASVDDLLELLAEVNDQVGFLMIVGHNPGLTDLANHLGASPIDHMPTCSHCKIDWPVDQWKEAVSIRGQVKAFDRPRMISKQAGFSTD